MVSLKYSSYVNGAPYFAASLFCCTTRLDCALRIYLWSVFPSRLLFFLFLFLFFVYIFHFSILSTFTVFRKPSRRPTSRLPSVSIDAWFPFFLCFYLPPASLYGIFHLPRISPFLECVISKRIRPDNYAPFPFTLLFASKIKSSMTEIYQNK